MKICILGHGRHGKDTLAELLNEYYGITYKSSSEMANELFIFKGLKEKYGYATIEQCFNDRHNHRKEWYDLICEYNEQDRARLAKEIVRSYDCYVGMRDLDEFRGSKDLFDLIIWVDASERLSEEKNSFSIDINQADLVIHNNQDLDSFKKKVRKIFDNYDFAKSHTLDLDCVCDPLSDSKVCEEVKSSIKACLIYDKDGVTFVDWLFENYRILQR
jgi:dephospho-CoA kinase